MVNKNYSLLWSIITTAGRFPRITESKNTMSASKIYEGLEYTTREINENFKIKVHGVNFDGPNMNKLVGVSGLIELIGVELTNRVVARAFNSKFDKCECRLRRGLRVTFYLF